MPPTVILIRHAQAEHSQYRPPTIVSFVAKLSDLTQNYDIPDPPLTSLGRSQCADLSKVLQSHPLYSKIDLIVVSSMHRTLETATYSLEPLIKSGVPVILSALFQENSAKPCDTGLPIPIVRQKWPQYDWDAVDPAFPSKEGIYEFSRKGITQRGIAAREWLRKRPEKVIAVVSHSGFLRVGLCYKFYANADFRIFDFGEGKGDVGGELIEWEETQGREGEMCGGMGKSLWGVAGMETQPFPEDNKTDSEVIQEKPKS